MTNPNPFRAAVVAPPGENPVQFGYWCPWCETSHAHGLAGKTTAEAIGAIEPRGSHCDPHRSPLAGKGVDLTIDRVVRSWEHLEPPGPFPTWPGDPLNTRLRLGEVLGTGLLGVALMCMIFGKRRPASGFDARLVGGRVQVWSGGSSWFLHNEAHDTLAEGRGLGALLARLFGIPVGVVAVRVIEDALALNLPSDYRTLIAGLIDRAARGEPLPSITEVCA